MIAAIQAFHEAPRIAAVYNLGGGRESNCSMLEAVETCQRIADDELEWSFDPNPRVGDHMWWISDLDEFRRDFPDWSLSYDVTAILEEIYSMNAERWLAATA